MRKSTIDQLAIFGGPPLFDETLHVGRPNLGERTKFLARLSDLLDRRWLTNNGPYVKDLERQIASLVGVKHCIAMCNGTVALEIAIRALEMRGEVIVPSFTFVATAHALQWQEITPVFCDVDPETYNLDPKVAETLVTPHTTGIIGVHTWGRACDIPALADLARRRGLKLLFDAAHAFACSHGGQMIGNFGDAEVFSFHATKVFNTFEGGAVVTNDDDLGERLRLMRNFGFSGLDNVIHIGVNGKMTEVSAAMGLTNLEGLDGFIAANHANYSLYRRNLTGVPGIRVVTFEESERNNFQYLVLEIDESITGVSRDLMIQALHAEKIRARRYFYPGCHRMEPYRSFFPHAGLLLPHTERLVTRVISLPTGATVSAQDVEAICDVVRFIVSSGPDLTQRLTQSVA